jgi:hypothetical protein
MNEEIVSKGINEDYIWHEAKSMLAKMKSLQYQFEELVSTMSKRDKENKAVIAKLYAKLYAENFQMNQEIKDLKERSA